MAEVATVFFAVAGITFLGFVASRLFERTGFPDIPVLLAVGLLLGPVNRLAAREGAGIQALADTITPDLLRDVGPYISGLALVVILFDSGLKLDFLGFRRSLGFAFLHTMPIFLLTVAGLAAIGHYVLGMPTLVAVVLGVAFSNVGQTVSAAILRSMRIGDDTRSVGLVEMAIYDTISIPILVALFALADGTGGEALGSSLRGFAQLLSISLVFGGAAGILWILALESLGEHPNAYMLTLAVLLSLYAANHVAGGSGAVSVLLFGLILGNRAGILRILRRPKPSLGSERVQSFHDEITFLVRTVFFLFLGMSFRLDLAGEWPVATAIPVLDALNHRGSLFALGVAAILAWFVAARWLAITAISARIRPETKRLIPVFGHGLGTAVLATLPFVALQYTPGTAFHALFSPWEPVFLNAAFVLILGSVALSSVFVWLQERRGRGRPAPQAATPAATARK
jgi:potassium/hydrogen antiporter